MNKPNPTVESKERAGHTPGPWTVDPPAMGFSMIRSPSGPVMALAAPGPEFGDREYSAEEKYANLALLGAAPDLLTALTEMIAAVELEGADGQRFYDARNAGLAAIAKATGGKA